MEIVPASRARSKLNEIVPRAIFGTVREMVPGGYTLSPFIFWSQASTIPTDIQQSIACSCSPPATAGIQLGSPIQILTEFNVA